MKNAFRRILKVLGDILFPPTCIYCGNFIEKDGLCVSCWNKIKWISEPNCKICGMPLDTDEDTCEDCARNVNYFDKAVSVFLYDSFSKSMILRFKDSDATYMAPIFAEWLNRIIRDLIHEIDIIVPVPVRLRKRIFRRYNQTELLAQELHKILHVKYDPRILQKSKETAVQKTLSRQQRIRNLHGSFRVNEQCTVNGKAILLVDDVMTTGATVNECAKVLKESGASKVYVATIARVRLRSK